jgi:hypothetical protein
MHTLSARFSPVWGWALAGAVAFPGLMALGYLSTRPLIARFTSRRPVEGLQVSQLRAEIGLIEVDMAHNRHAGER